MCGISGLIWADKSRPAGLEELRLMNRLMHHRGPDDAGEYLDGPVALGHRRLSIIDLSAHGHQPMLSDDHRYAITFNGEIYNYLELRSELKALGHSFRSGSDTEVLLRAYIEWGPDCAERLNGMWAFAIYDKLGRKLFLSRDRFGIKPLYVVRDAGRFAFASEMKALLGAFQDLRVVNYSFLHYFLPSGALDDGPETVFEAIELMPPAHNAVYDLESGSFTLARYWTIEPETFRQRWVGDDPVASLRALLESSLELQMRSDVPVGTCLSGGIDSSAIVGLLARLRQEPMHTYSGLYPDAGFNEEEYVVAVRNHAGVLGADIRRQPQGDFVDDIATITWHQDMPTAGPGLYTQFHVMERASRDVKVLLDGQGADEIFAGYLPYYPLRINDLLKSGRRADWVEAHLLMITVLRHWGTQWLAGVQGSPLLDSANAWARRLQRKLRPAPPSSQEPPFFHPSLPARVAGTEIVRTRTPVFADSLSEVLRSHLQDSSIPALLHYEDRNSMAFSIEARVPYLDHRIVEFALGLDAAFKIRRSWTKWVLRKATADRLPAKVAWRRSKLGYPTPAARWMRQGKDRDELKELLYSPSFLGREIVTRESLDHYWNQHQAGTDRSWLLYRYATTELWFRHFIDAFQPKPARAAPTSPDEARQEGGAMMPSMAMTGSTPRWVEQAMTSG